MTLPAQPKSRRGFVRHDKNPFINDASANTRSGIKRVSNKSGDRMMIVSERTGEIVAPASFWQAQEVDKTQFVKLYVNGVKAIKDLTGAGTTVFHLLYLEVQKNTGRDVVYLSYTDINQADIAMSKATFMKGMKELIEKGFIAESLTQGKYFLNPDFMFNGDRLAFIREVRLKGGSYPDPRQGTLDLESPTASSNPAALEH